jgi:spermidine synthase
MADGPEKGRAQWADELHKQILLLRYKMRRKLFSGQSEYQRIEIVETDGFGRMLFNDGVAMLSERDEFVYHEMISHVPLFVHPLVERVLVIGGGDGGTVREVLRHKSVRHCRLVEIDSMVVESCRQHLPVTAAALDDPRATVTIADGVRFVAETNERYDLVIVDSTDPVGPAEPLFGPDFYGNLCRVLNKEGVVVSQAESPYFDADRQSSLLHVLAGLFSRVHIYNYVTITYPGGLWSFTYATNGGLCPVGDFDPDRLDESGLEFNYYSADVHRAAFVLPVFQERRLRGIVTPIHGRAGGR